MVATAIGLPLAIWIEQHLGWRASFWAVVILLLISGLIGLFTIPSLPKSEKISFREEIGALKNPRLWAAYSTSMLIIGGTFAAFSYFSPILTDLSGFGAEAVPMLLGIYGIATVIGNIVTGRLADHYMMPILTIGLTALTAALVMFGLFVHSPAIAVISVVIVGLVGVPMNPAMATRVTRVADTGSIVTTIHSSVISLGVMVGSSLGGLTIDAGLGLASPLWVGALLAVLGLLSLLPAVRGEGRAKRVTSSH